MQYRTIKKNNDFVSLLGYGCMRLPEKNGKIDEEKTREQFTYAIDKGINYFDTGFLYHAGQGEVVLGNMIAKNGFREKIKIATKLPHWMCDKYEDFTDFLNLQISRLQVNRIDYYLIHALKGTSWEKLKTLNIQKFLDKVKKDGRVSFVGFSFHDNFLSFKKIVDEYDWDICQIQYNILDEKNQAGSEGLNYAAKRELGVIIMEPLRGGLLGNMIPDEIQKIYNESGIQRTPAEWALSWIMNNPDVSSVLSGMNSIAQLEENVRIASTLQANTMTAQELKIIDDVKNIYRLLMKIDCTGCGYCLPCPAGVDIPVCFELYNSKYLKLNGKDNNTALGTYAFRCGGASGNPGLASQCVECGACEKKCPQGINIREQLKKVKAEFEGIFFKQRIDIFKMFLNRIKKNVKTG